MILQNHSTEIKSYELQNAPLPLFCYNLPSNKIWNTKCLPTNLIVVSHSQFRSTIFSCLNEQFLRLVGDLQGSLIPWEKKK